ncbi:MAG: hypothetical protein AB8B65_04620 [Kordia sp.]|uniref:hypothetical protein n=1 Tax=Kordia sp. TaxID=1965332 RepID=UPI00385A4B14
MKTKTIFIADETVAIDTDYLNPFFLDEIEETEILKIQELTNLQHLNISSTEIEDKHLAIIGEINSIELLDIDATKITDEGIQLLQSLQYLKQLRLKDNPQLTDACIKYLSNIKSLEMIHIGNTSITVSGLKKLPLDTNLNSIILSSNFKNSVEDLCLLSTRYPKLEITLKGTGVITRGKLN